MKNKKVKKKEIEDENIDDFFKQSIIGKTESNNLVIILLSFLTIIFKQSVGIQLIESMNTNIINIKNDFYLNI